MDWPRVNGFTLWITRTCVNEPMHKSNVSITWALFQWFCPPDNATRKNNEYKFFIWLEFGCSVNKSWYKKRQQTNKVHPMNKPN